jgi:hypothetical protein
MHNQPPLRLVRSRRRSPRRGSLAAVRPAAVGLLAPQRRATPCVPCLAWRRLDRPRPRTRPSFFLEKACCCTTRTARRRRIRARVYTRAGPRLLRGVESPKTIRASNRAPRDFACRQSARRRRRHERQPRRGAGVTTPGMARRRRVLRPPITSSSHRAACARCTSTGATT